MPFYLKDRDIFSDVATVHSVLIVPCRFCPAASFAVKERKPYIELFGSLLRTASYEAYIQLLKSRLERKGIRTGVFDSKLPHQFVACMWALARRKELARRAVGYDAVIVLGCDAAVEMIRSCLQSMDCRVIPGMKVEGIMNVIPTLPGEPIFHKHFPNSFRETTLLEHFRDAKISRLVIVGMMTHKCIDTSTRAAADLGFVCSLAHDACATRALSFGGVQVSAESVQIAYLAALNGLFARVLTGDELCAESSAA